MNLEYSQNVFRDSEKSVFVLSEQTKISVWKQQPVVLSCKIDPEKCGELHSVKWQKGDNSRVAVVSGNGEISIIEDQYKDR